MNTKEDSVNLGDDDIVKNTQFSGDDNIGSEFPSSSEQRVLYGSTKDTAAYRNSPYNSIGGMRLPAMQHPQVPYSQHHAWPDYSTSYSSGVHPMQHVVGTRMYSPFSGGNFSGMSQSNSSHTYGGRPDSFLWSQMGHVPVAPPNMEWMNMRNMVPPSQDPYRLPPFFSESTQTVHPRPLSTREPESSKGPWYCPRSRAREACEGEQKNTNEEHFMSGFVNTSDDRSMRNRTRIGETQPSELRHSPPPESAETQQGPLRNESAGAERTPVASKCWTQTFQGGTPSQCTSGMQKSVENPSKSNTPQSGMQRKALREDEKTYLKEVKAAIAEGRVPQVTIPQDENGNIVRFKSQFINALKLAAHAIVQDAYINVTDKETMNEIMKEVRRQFVLPKPLPAGMVESYLKGYFKRCRCEYHKFWIRNGDKKKPDGCKQAAWLQLIEYWKSTDGQKECKQNKKNVTRQTSKVQEKKLQSDGDWFGEDVEIVDAHIKGSSEQKTKEFFSDSVAAESQKPASGATGCPVAVRNPMADISNELHKAVDTILSSFAGRCGSLPSLTAHQDCDNIVGKFSEYNVFKSCRGVDQTSAEVLESLKQPETDHYDIGGARKGAPNPDIAGRIPGKLHSANKQTSEYANVKCRAATLETKASVNDLLGGKETDFRNNEAEVRDIGENVGIERDFTVLLSSDESSDGVYLKSGPGDFNRRVNDITSIPCEAYTEEVEGWTKQTNRTGSDIKKSRKRTSAEVNKAIQKPWKQTQCKEPSKQRPIRDEEELVCERGKKEVSKRKMSNTMRTPNSESDNDFHADSESSLKEDIVHSDALEEDNEDVSDKEEAPVRPREAVKRNLDSQYGGRSTTKEVKEGGNRRSNKAAQKKLKCKQVDASVLKKLTLYKRPKNSNPIKTRTRVWVLHPKFVGKVVAEANAGVNRKSRCVDSANEICKEGQQMISVIRVLYKNTPVMFDVNTRFPKHVSYLDQAEGVPNMPILWCVSHLVEMPPLEQITRLLGEFITPLSQESDHTDTDFNDSNKRVEKSFRVGSLKDSGRGRVSNAGSTGATVLKNGRTVLRSANV